MAINNRTSQSANWLISHLPAFVLLLFVLQPLMDILSFWMDRLGIGNTLTLALRCAVFAATALLGFCVSRRKKAYGTAAAACAVLLIGHVLACSVVGYLNPVADLTNFVRVVQMPVFVFCLISFARANDRCYRAMENGLILNFWVISLSVLVSAVTGTAGATYQGSGIGLLGWFSTTNAQSAVMSMLAPIVLMVCFRQKKFFLFVLTTAVAFAQLYLMGTRLAFLAIGVCAVGIPIVMLLTRQVSKRYIAVLVVGLALCCGLIKISPMYKNQHIYDTEMAGKQSDAEVMMERAGSDSSNFNAVEQYHALSVIYHYYTPALCERFGTARVMGEYDYTSQITSITATRHRKIVFCEMLMDEHPRISRLFGMELGRMTWNGDIYDVENDFHGIYFLYGWFGLALMLAFIGYFLYLVVRALFQDFRKYFTLEAGGVGMSLCLALVYAYNTAGVLRRPNSSFYLSVLLAAVYYLVQLRPYPKNNMEKEAISE